MSTPDYAGYWTGSISGTNTGGLALTVTQNGDTIEGVAKLQEPGLGSYEYHLSGKAAEQLSFKMVPGRQSGGLNLGIVQVVCALQADGTLSGRWKSDVQTEGVFSAKRFDAPKLGPEMPSANSVFLVHGHDEGAMQSVARFIEQLGVRPVILQEQINQGMTVIEKFEAFAGQAGFAVVLLTPDDVGYPVCKEEEKKRRPRQNVVLELGYFAAKLGRKKTLVFTKGDVEMPSDIFGLVYEPIDKGEGWKVRLARELKAAGFKVDLNKAIG